MSSCGIVEPAPSAANKPKTAKPVAEEKKPKVKKADAKGDDLKKIEGIGPKIAEILTNAGIDSFEALSKSTPEKIKEILEGAGSRYKMHDPTTWPDQSALAASDKWDELKELQDNLKGGK